MKLATTAIDEAEGAILAHSLDAGAGVIKKGTRLGADEIARLRAAGQARVVVARLEPGDVPEDAAAERLARAAAGPGILCDPPFTGRVNLRAVESGLVQVDAALLTALNSIDEGLTLATLHNFSRATSGQLVATAKIIPFAIPETVVARAEALLAEAPSDLLALRPFVAQRAGLLLTTGANASEKVLEKRERAVRARLERLGVGLEIVTRAEHKTPPLARALKDMAREGLDLVIVFAASAIVDREDVVPAALVEAGGAIRQLGLPVDPGNLLLLGALAGAHVIGAPSCAASLSANGFDLVLERLAAGLEVGRQEIAAMALGGLLKEIPSRPQPRERPPPGQRASAHPLRVAGPSRVAGASRVARPLRVGVSSHVGGPLYVGGIVLAAGRSTRMGARNKLLAPVGSEAMVRHVVRALCVSRAAPRIVVTGHEAARIREALAGLDCQFAHNPNYEKGLATSLRAGLDALAAMDQGEAPPAGALILLGDMPGVSRAVIDRLIAAFIDNAGEAICVPVRGGRRGNPVLWPAALFDEMRAIEGDTGARHLIGAHEERVVEVAADSDGVLIDIDTPEALARYGA